VRVRLAYGSDGLDIELPEERTIVTPVALSGSRTRLPGLICGFRLRVRTR
jgi:hypothetical protein